MRVFKNLGWFFKLEKKSYIIGLVMLVLVALMELVPPQVIGRVIDQITTETLTSNTLILFGVMLVFVAILTYIFRFFWRVMIFGASNRLGRTLRERLFKKYSLMSPAFFGKRRTGDLMAHATNDINAVQMTAGAGILTIADSVITGGAVLITMALTVSPKLTLIAMIPLPFMVILTSWYGSILSRLFRVAQAAFSSLNDKTQESIAGIKVTKTFGYEDEDLKDFTNLSDDVVKKNLKVAKIDALFDPTITAIIAISYFLSIFFGARMVVADEITLGQLVTFTTYLGMMVWPLLALGWFFNLIERGKASYDRIEEIMNTKSDIGTNVTSDVVPSGDITFNVSEFSFPGEAEVSLRDIHFTLKEGETLGIVGRTGSGKSSIIRLLLREFDTDADNTVAVNGVDIKQADIKNLRQLFGYVPQDNFLFSTTIRNNIAFTNPDINIEKIYRAAELSYIHQDITAFPAGYDTIVGERGVSLSGGQKQRISIARALIENPEVLILDDSLSAVDAETETAILNNIEQNRRGKTNIITAHRMSAVRDADLILVMEDGRIIERGNHASLTKAKGWYYETFKTQSLRQSLSKALDETLEGGRADDN
ncbi:ABC transporter ATP-binding protein [Jeotgalicoccus sp. WY2]|uniref:ABC transporter ATP-binding protein n=1 Tax=Jeotgalicoccus sp. WY2 TaxID=2708346 RepID=UPI001BD4D988|nr:ABC transporter transmembrane domain-containing protein [Jeotgalicoccus sp. WY2]